MGLNEQSSYVVFLFFVLNIVGRKNHGTALHIFGSDAVEGSSKAEMCIIWPISFSISSMAPGISEMRKSTPTEARE